MEDAAYCTVALVTAFVLGAIVTWETNLRPIEHHLQKYCTDIGSTLKEYDRDDELVCENGATFKYTLEGKL